MKFSRLFKGRHDYYGTYVIEGSKGEKVIGAAKTINKKVTEKLYQDHLDGKQSLGMVPLTEDGFCWFAALDIYVYDLKFDEFEAEINQLGLPFNICRTKSGGVHLYVFFKAKVKAPLVRRKLKEFATSLGYSDAEIFPKQDKGNPGNWINLPYFNYQNTNRYAYKNGQILSLDEFLEKVEMITGQELENLIVPILEDISDAPPCLQTLCKNGIAQGQKELSLFNLAVYCKLKYPDGWEDKLSELNQLYCKPPALNATVEKAIKTHRRKSFFYQCDKFPLVQFCNKDFCKKLIYGIGNESPSVSMGDLVKINSDPPIWYMGINNIKIQFQTADLIEQSRFSKLCMEKINTLPKRLKEITWKKIIQEKLDSVTEIQAPDDAGSFGQFVHLLRAYCTERPPARNKGEILQHKPWTNDQKTYFQSNDLLTFLNQRKFNQLRPNAIYNKIRELGGESSLISIKGIKVRVWNIPEFEKQTEEFDQLEISDDPY